MTIKEEFDEVLRLQKMAQDSLRNKIQELEKRIERLEKLSNL